MSKSLKDAQSLHTDHHDANAISPVVNSSDEAGQENDKAGHNSYDEPVKGVPENLETSSTRKEDKRHKSRKRKINPPSSSPEIVKAPTKRDEKSQGQGKEKGKVAFLILILIQFIIQLVY